VAGGRRPPSATRPVLPTGRRLHVASARAVPGGHAPLAGQRGGTAVGGPQPVVSRVGRCDACCPGRG